MGRYRRSKFSKSRRVKRSENKSRGRKRVNRSKTNKKIRVQKRGGRSNKNTKRRMRGGSDYSEGDKPICVITFGPTGAGKSHLHESVMIALHEKGILTNVNPTDWAMILIDDIIAGVKREREPSNAYRESILQIFNEILPDKGDVNQVVKDLFQNPTSGQLKKFSKAYFDARGVDPCEPHTSSAGINCDNYNDELLNDAITSGKNVVIEMRGLYKPEWVYDELNKHSEPGRYHVVLAVSCVHNIDDLIERNKKRAKETAMMLIDIDQVEGGTGIESVTELPTNKQSVLEKLETMNPLPRLPDINFDHYKKQCEKIHKVTKDCIASRIFGEWNPHIVMVDNSKFPNEFTDTEMGESHWMFKAGPGSYLKGNKHNLGPCVVIPALNGINPLQVVDWIVSHNNDTLFGVHENETTNSVLEEHHNRLDEHERPSSLGVTLKTIEAVNKFKKIIKSGDDV